jgi:hypothetical protein
MPLSSKHERPDSLNVDGTEAKVLAENISYYESNLVEKHRPNIRMGSQAAKSHAVG